MNEIELARSILKQDVLGNVGLLTTVDRHGHPHATWMSTYSVIERNQIITLTSPDSEKVQNIAKNPRVEWLFTSTEYEYLIYFVGRAYVELDPKIFKKHWLMLPDKQRAYFLESYNSPPGFVTIRTEIDKVNFTIPKESKTVELDVTELLSEG